MRLALACKVYGLTSDETDSAYDTEHQPQGKYELGVALHVQVAAVNYEGDEELDPLVQDPKSKHHHSTNVVHCQHFVILCAVTIATTCNRLSSNCCPVCAVTIATTLYSTHDH